MKVHVKHTLKTDVASALKLCTELKTRSRCTRSSAAAT